MSSKPLIFPSVWPNNKDFVEKFQTVKLLVGISSALFIIGVFRQSHIMTMIGASTFGFSWSRYQIFNKFKKQ